MPLLLIALFIVVPIVELYVIIQVGKRSGPADADTAPGRCRPRRAPGPPSGPRRLAALQRGPAERRFPHREVADGLMIAVGGTLLLTPGFVTDIFGAILPIPPTRAIVRGLLKRFTIGRFTGGRDAGRRPVRADARAGRPGREPRLRLRRDRRRGAG